MQHLLTWIVFWACFARQYICMPASSDQTVAYYAERYGWPKEVLDLLLGNQPIPVEDYTKEQASNFVTNALLYFEQHLIPNQAFNILGKANHISQSFVEGTDDALSGNIKPKWRWLPLIDGFDAHSQPVYHVSTWKDGAQIRSLDMLRVDYYYSQRMRFLVPTAIVRPFQRESIFGRGLQLTTVYEYPTSLPRYRRNATPASAVELYDAIRSESQQWLALLNSANRLSLHDYYQKLTPAWIYDNLQPKRRKMRQQNILPDSVNHLQGLSPVIIDSSAGAWHPQTQAGTSNQIGFAQQGHQLMQAPPLVDHNNMQQQPRSSSSMELPSTILQLGQNEPRLHSQPPTQSSQLDGSWLRLGFSRNTQSPE